MVNKSEGVLRDRERAKRHSDNHEEGWVAHVKKGSINHKYLKRWSCKKRTFNDFRIQSQRLKYHDFI